MRRQVKRECGHEGGDGSQPSDNLHYGLWACGARPLRVPGENKGDVNERKVDLMFHSTVGWMDANIDLSFIISPQAGDYENAEKHSMQLWRQVNYLSLLPSHVSQSSQHNHYD